MVNETPRLIDAVSQVRRGNGPDVLTNGFFYPLQPLFSTSRTSMALSLQEVSQHNSAKSCWVIIHNHVYDVTEFLPDHPGGAKIILKYAGKDATEAFEPIHPPDALTKFLPPEKHLGPIDEGSARIISEAYQQRKKTQDELRVELARKEKPPLSRVLNALEMEAIAKKILSYKAWAFFSSAGDDGVTHEENIRAFSRFFFHARVLRPISNCDPSTSILGFRSPIPIFVSATGAVKLGNPAGEASITRGCGRTGIIQMVSSSASLSYAEIDQARIDKSQPLFFQLYKIAGEHAIDRVRDAESLGYNAIFLTVDAPVLGNREKDIRAPFELADQEREAKRLAAQKEGSPEIPLDPDTDSEKEDMSPVARLAGGSDADMSWEKTIPWLRSVTKLPIVLKGIQCVEDAVLAAEAGVDGILISNHGGRQLEYSMPSIEVLYRLRKERPDVFSKLEVYMDGGVRRGTDVIKALCLGAKAVGIGRPFLYALSAYGEEGVEHLVRIFESEIIRGMRLLGATKLSELVPEMVEKVDWQPILARL